MVDKSNIIDLFSGCGGLSLGFEQAGYNVILGIDNWKDALITFEKNHKNTDTLCTDLAKYDPNELVEKYKNLNIDVIIGGPPCQGYSIAGKRIIDDERNLLYKAFVGIVKTVKPRAFVMENVPNILSMGEGIIKDQILSDFKSAGYNVTYKILKASDFGVPQNRRRAFFVGLLDGEFEFPEPMNNLLISAKDAISDLPENSVVDGTPYAVSPQSEYQFLMRNNSQCLYNHLITDHAPETIRIINMVPDGGNYKDLPKDLQNTRKVNIAWTRLSSEKPSFTIDTGHRHHFHYSFNRVPTVRESARIQSFPDDFIFYGSKTSQYKQVGNAVPPILAYALAKHLKKLL